MYATIFQWACMYKAQTLLMLGVLCLMPFSAGAQAFPTITLCNQCSAEWEYRKTALWSSDLSPGQSEEIYIVNFSVSQVRAYRVGLTIADPDSGDRTFDVDVTAINGDPVVLDDIVAAVDIVNNPQDERGQAVRAEELGLSHGPDSALDLIGPVPGSASLNQRAVENALTGHYRNFRPQPISGAKTFDQILDQFLAYRNLIIDKAVAVRFGDGTKVRVNVEEIGRDLSDPTKIITTFDTDVSSITAPGISEVPKSPGQFSGFSASGLDSNLAAQLRDLAFRFEIALVGPDDAEECTTTIRCELMEFGGETSCTTTPDC